MKLTSRRRQTSRQFHLSTRRAVMPDISNTHLVRVVKVISIGHPDSVVRFNRSSSRQRHVLAPDGRTPLKQTQSYTELGIYDRQSNQPTLCSQHHIRWLAHVYQL